jgi:4-hydroxy-2-oxoheptanedioate aldolase
VDLWPLHPDGDLLAIIMIESVDGLQNLNTIASTPGVGTANDLTRSMGVRPRSPEVEAGLQKVVSMCEARRASPARATT